MARTIPRIRLSAALLGVLKVLLSGLLGGLLSGCDTRAVTAVGLLVLAAITGVVIVLYQRWRSTGQGLDMTRLAVVMSLPDGRWEATGIAEGRVHRGDRAVAIDLFDAMKALAQEGMPGILVYVGTALYFDTTEAYRKRIEDYVVSRLRARHPDMKVVNDDGRALTVRAQGSTFELSRMAMLLEFWGRDQEPEEARQALVDKILDARLASNDAALSRERILPRFTTPDREARMLGMIQTSRKVKGLRWPVDCVFDQGALCVTVRADALEGLGVKSMQGLHALALENLRPRLKPLSDAGLHVVKDRADHAAVQVLLVPERLSDGQAMYAVAPSPGELYLWRDGDHASARAARKRMKKADPNVAPIPKPVRITREGFARASWAEVTGPSETSLEGPDA